MSPKYLAMQARRIRDDLREIADTVEGIAHPEIFAAIIKTTGAVQSLEDHLWTMETDLAITRFKPGVLN